MCAVAGSRKRSRTTLRPVMGRYTTFPCAPGCCATTWSIGCPIGKRVLSVAGRFADFKMSGQRSTIGLPQIRACRQVTPCMAASVASCHFLVVLERPHGQQGGPGQRQRLMPGGVFSSNSLGMSTAWTTLKAVVPQKPGAPAAPHRPSTSHSQVPPTAGRPRP
jgi:hypothetical protein